LEGRAAVIAFSMLSLEPVIQGGVGAPSIDPPVQDVAFGGNVCPGQSPQIPGEGADFVMVIGGIKPWVPSACDLPVNGPDADLA